MPLKKGM